MSADVATDMPDAPLPRCEGGSHFWVLATGTSRVQNMPPAMPMQSRCLARQWVGQGHTDSHVVQRLGEDSRCVFVERCCRWEHVYARSYRHVHTHPIDMCTDVSVDMQLNIPVDMLVATPVDMRNFLQTCDYRILWTCSTFCRHVTAYS